MNALRSPAAALAAPLLLLLAPAAFPARAAQPQRDPSLLTVDRIFAGSEFSARRYAARWAPDGDGYLRWETSRDTPGGRELARYDAETGERTVVVPAARLVPPGRSEPLDVDDYAFSGDGALLLIYTNSQRVWRLRTRGDYWVLDRASHELVQLGGDAPPASLMFAKLAPQGRRVAYVRQRNIYVEDLRTGAITQLTQTESDDVINGTFDWVYEEEFHLRDGFRWSPDGRQIAYWQINTEGVRRFPLVNNTDSLYPRITWIPYPKAGERNSACRVGVVSADGGPTRWLHTPGDPRNMYIARMEWPEGGQDIVLQQLNRLQNVNRVMLADPQTGAVRPILEERDEAWVDVHDEMFWFDEGRRFTWISERDGWRHAYLADRSGQPPRLATPGPYDVIELLQVDEKNEWLYFLASPDNATQRYLYRVRFDGSGLARLTPEDQPGSHSYNISPNCRWAIHTYSRFGQPPVVDLVRLPGHESVRLLETNEGLKRRLAKLKLGKHELFQVEIGDGVRLDGWALLPPDFDPGQKHPLLVYVYGEPAGTTVRDSWGGGNYLWHLMLAQKGYVVMSFDNRGTPAPKGRAWRKIIYRQVGVLAPQDQAAAVRAVLRERPYLDPERVGVWGWSGGGSMTLNAILKYPDLYRVGIAVAPVPNQRYYDTIYQERYMGLPDENVENFIQGSPIHFAGQLKGDLLLIHGTGDDNVHYQGTQALINELIRHNKPFAMMAYPNRSHSISEGRNTTRHLRSLMLRYLLDHLPPGPRPGRIAQAGRRPAAQPVSAR